MNPKITFFIVLVSAIGSVVGQEDTGSLADTKSEHYGFPAPKISIGMEAQKPRKWISQLFQEAERSFSIGPRATDQCRRDFEMYKLHLHNQSVWAVRMMESSEWPVVGVFYGVKYHIGNWRDCMLVRGPGIKGQYCLVHAALNFTFNVEPTRSTSEWVEWPDEKASTWRVLKMYETQSVRVDRLQQNWGLCIPSSCTTLDLTNSLNDLLNPIFKEHGIDITITGHSRLCTVEEKQQQQYSLGYYFTGLFFAGLFLLVLTSSMYDILNCSSDDKENNRVRTKLFKCFSMKSNLEYLIHTPTISHFPAIYAGKFIFMCSIIYAHRLFLTYAAPMTDTESMEMTYKPPHNVEIINSSIVDVFFLFSGFFTCLHGITPMARGGIYYLVTSVVVRWLRMVPVLFMVMLFVTYILPHLGDGPFWDFKISDQVDVCKSNWWAHLLTINNIVNPEQQCLLVSYYVAVDMQLSILGAIVLFTITRSKKIGTLLILSTLTIASVITFTTVYINKYDGHIRFTLGHLEEGRNFEEFTSFYFSTYPRVAPYILGMIAALLGMRMKKNNIKFTTMQVYVILALLALVGNGSQLYAYEFYKIGRPYWALENALFASVHRILYILPFVFGVSVYMSSGIVVCKRLLHFEVFVPLGRLVYCALFSSFTLQTYYGFNQKMPTSSISRITITWIAVGDIVFAFTVAFFMYLIWEGPLKNLINIMLNVLIEKLLENRKFRRRFQQRYPQTEW